MLLSPLSSLMTLTYLTLIAGSHCAQTVNIRCWRAGLQLQLVGECDINSRLHACWTTGRINIITSDSSAYLVRILITFSIPIGILKVIRICIGTLLNALNWITRQINLNERKWQVQRSQQSCQWLSSSTCKRSVGRDTGATDGVKPRPSALYQAANTTEGD